MLRQLFYAESPAHEHPTGFKVWQPDNKKACQVVCHLTGFVLFLPCHDGAIIVARVGLRVGPVLVSIVPQHVKRCSSHNTNGMYNISYTYRSTPNHIGFCRFSANLKMVRLTCRQHVEFYRFFTPFWRASRGQFYRFVTVSVGQFDHLAGFCQ